MIDYEITFTLELRATINENGSLTDAKHMALTQLRETFEITAITPDVAVGMLWPQLRISGIRPVPTPKIPAIRDGLGLNMRRAGDDPLKGFEDLTGEPEEM